MFGRSGDAGGASLSILTDVKALMASLDTSVEDAARVDAIRLLEEIKHAAGAAQARMTVALEASQRASQQAGQALVGERAERLGRGVGAQVGLARRISPHEGRRYVGR